MTLTDQLRDLLKKAAAPLSLDQIMEHLPGAKRDTVAALLSQRKKAGEFVACVENGKAAYAVASGYRASPKLAPKRFDKQAKEPTGESTEATLPTVPSAAHVEPTANAVERLTARRTTGVSGLNQLEALRRSLSAAEAARDAYVETVVDQRFYGHLQESVRASREALAQFERGAA